jgi:hypothetical protein
MVAITAITALMVRARSPIAFEVNDGRNSTITSATIASTTRTPRR